MARLRPPPGHRQQCRDVVHHRLHPGSNRLKAGQPQQVESCGSQRGYRAGAITAVTVGILMELGVAEPVPDLIAPAVSHQLQQRLWSGAQTGEEQVVRLKGLAVALAGGRHLHEPAGANPGLGDVRRCLFGTQGPDDGAAMDDLVIRCHEEDLALSLELAADLPVQRLLVGLDRQQEVGPCSLSCRKTGAGYGARPPG